MPKPASDRIIPPRRSLYLSILKIIFFQFPAPDRFFVPEKRVFASQMNPLFMDCRTERTVRSTKNGHQGKNSTNPADSNERPALRTGGTMLLACCEHKSKVRHSWRTLLCGHHAAPGGGPRGGPRSEALGAGPFGRGPWNAGFQGAGLRGAGLRGAVFRRAVAPPLRTRGVEQGSPDVRAEAELRPTSAGCGLAAQLSLSE